MQGRRQVVYDPMQPSVAVPIIAHSNEVVINVDLAKKLYPILKHSMNLPFEIRRELLKLFETTPTN